MAHWLRFGIAMALITRSGSSMKAHTPSSTLQILPFALTTLVMEARATSLDYGAAMGENLNSGDMIQA
jgi:hypothetical protein